MKENLALKKDSGPKVTEQHGATSRNLNLWIVLAGRGRDWMLMHLAGGEHREFFTPVLYFDCCWLAILARTPASSFLKHGLCVVTSFQRAQYGKGGED